MAAMLSESEIIASLERVWASRPSCLHVLELHVSTSNPSHYRIDIATTKREKVLRTSHDNDGADRLVEVATEWRKHLYFDANDEDELAQRAGHVEGLARLGHALLEDMAANAPKDHEHRAVDRNDIPRDAAGWRSLYRRGDT